MPIDNVLLYVCEWPPFHCVCRFLKPWSTSRPPMMIRPTTWSIVGEWDFKKWRLTYASYKTSLKNGKALATVDLEDEDGDKGTLPHRLRGHKATMSDIKCDTAALALRRPLPRERRRGARRRRPHVINSLTSQKRQLRLKRACQRQRPWRPRPN
jgi:hypothetical protein